ncbi:MULTISPECIES: pyridoxamine 5'-phosphate oxidase family protein [Streptomyces]|uniref:Pyridoxamine 5'-phosphate oxidase family protein n=1 Tax=Streptomyces cyaneofuscatus TaxID=66883 RepID=A0ABZ1EWP0_9ACTN|nr:pyridoxamine 5'-phosphate oxidase family protein [Streptomyces cyaneofuscatus]WSB08545.1 pyridoxamine 5'-phosphate oxidase family protein [Streptomyces cyaneofuscatus]WSD47922.1 pyridoxamine 5'-phosphate oxidase family protein [Streptomyces cyaneofuscatus]WTA91292.1 pyridoxamine 5'-phosphate oxidase family protein [Streptomyces cyaneofuscatus]
MSRFNQLAQTTAVRQVQEEMGSASAAGRRLREQVEEPDPLDARSADFIRSLDGFLFASVGETGWPYIQFKGGPQGFVHVLDPYTLAFLDVRGNRQYVTAGNVRGDDRVALFFIDHARQARLKVFGHATAVPVDQDLALAERLESPRTEGRVEQIMTVRVEAYAWNCPNHITPRFSEREVSEALAPLHERLARLEEENAALRAEIAARP